MAKSRGSVSRSACVVLSEGPRFAHCEDWERWFLLGQDAAPPEDARQLRFSPGSAGLAARRGWRCGWETTRIHLYSGVSIHPGAGGTVPKEMVSSPLNPLLRFRK